MVRMLNSPRPEVPTYLDELAFLFGTMPDPEFNGHRRPLDTEYTLLTAVVEMGEWLEEPYNKHQRPGDRHSMLADLRLALSLRGPKVMARTPEGVVFLKSMQDALQRGDHPPARLRRSSR